MSGADLSSRSDLIMARPGPQDTLPGRLNEKDKAKIMGHFIRKKSLEELVGQVFMVGFEGTRFNSDLSYFLKKLHVGGVIYFKRNVQDPYQLAELSRSL
jgi:hypothetical protein